MNGRAGSNSKYLATGPRGIALHCFAPLTALLSITGLVEGLKYGHGYPSGGHPRTIDRKELFDDFGYFVGLTAEGLSIAFVDGLSNSLNAGASKCGTTFRHKIE